MSKDDGKVKAFLGADQGADELNPQELESISGSLPPGMGGGGGHNLQLSNDSCLATTDSAGMGCSGTGDG